MGTKGDERLKESLEDHIATINRHLKILALAHENATDRALRRTIASEIDYYTKELGRVQRAYDEAVRRIERKGR